MSRMMLYFEICRASCGAIPWTYLESLPVIKLHYIYKAAQVVNLRQSIETIANVNAGFAGSKKRVNALQKQLESLTWEKPKTEVSKLKKWKRKMRRAKRAARDKVGKVKRPLKKIPKEKIKTDKGW